MAEMWQQSGDDLATMVHPVEVAMIAEGALLRVGPREDDLVRVEELGIGDSVWDCRAGRAVDITTMACATLGPDELEAQGFRAMHLSDGGLIAISSPRLGNAGPRRDAPEPAAKVYYRIWPELQMVMQVGRSHALLRPATWER